MFGIVAYFELRNSKSGLFDNISGSMFTLLRLAGGEGFGFLQPVIEEDPGYLAFFIVFYILAVLGMMNGMIAVFGAAFVPVQNEAGNHLLKDIHEQLLELKKFHRF